MKTQSNKQKLYCYVDETGQDTAGRFFLVSVIIVEKNKDEIERKLIEIEKESKKSKTKWHRAKFYQREAYIDKILELKDLKKSLYYSKYENTILFYQIITYTVTQAIYDKASENYIANITIDGLPRNLEPKLAVSFRSLRIKTGKIKGARDESSAFIRLADSIAGLVRDSYEGNKWAKEKLRSFERNAFIKRI